MKGQALAVMYHYVWPDAKPVPGGIRPLLVSEFEAQLDWLSERYRIVHPDAFLKEVAAGDFKGKPPCLLTFDDGTRDHAEVAAPILAKRGLSGVFFVLAWPADLGRMPVAHAVHWLLGQDELAVWKAFEDCAKSELGGAAALGDPAQARRIYHYETPLRARIKYAANMALPQESARSVVLAALAAAGKKERELALEWFASSEQLADMKKSGMVIGLHGCSHQSLQALGGKGMAEEIRYGSAWLARTLGERPRWWACPFGGSGAPDSDHAFMKAAVKKAGLDAAVTTVVGDVPSPCDPMSLPRRDCASLPPRVLKTVRPAAKIRLSTPQDRDALLSFIEKSGFNPRDAVTWDGLGMMAMTAWDGKELVGAIPLEPRQVRLGGSVVKALHQTVVAVAEGHRGAGLGSRMQEEIARAAPGGAQLLSVYREEPGSPAYRWYAKNGFSPAMQIFSWFCDKPKGAKAGVAFSSPPAKPDDIAGLWEKWAASACGLVDRAARPLGQWLSVHPYRARYAFTLARLGKEDYALLGAGTMHSETKRADILEFVAGPAGAPKLLTAILGWAAEQGLAPVRWPISAGDPYEKVAKAAGFERRWGFDMLVKPLGSLRLPDGPWRYSGVDYA